MENKTIAIIQARLTSKRFPNKIIQKLETNTLIEFLLKRVRQSKKIDKVILAMPNNHENKKIKKIIKNVDFFFGNEEDVLDRYYRVAKKYSATI
jgi:spore coat polysaccharide biosynthesis protein SpsF (cytidylyltransferase family)